MLTLRQAHEMVRVKMPGDGMDERMMQRRANPYITSEKKSYDANPLRRFRIIIADADTRMSQVLRSALNKMGFSDIQMTASSEEAYSMMQTTRPDIIFTDSSTHGIGGIELVRRIRRDPLNTQPVLPILFFSGQTEEADVSTARDAGINEYVKKPFSAETLAARIEHVIDQPRHFIVVKGYVGPDRRRRGDRTKVLVERRRNTPMPRRHVGPFSRNPRPEEDALILSPDVSLREKLGSHGAFRNVMTPLKIQEAQTAIHEYAEEGLDWIRADLRQMRIYLHAIQAGEYAPFTTGALTARALEVRCRAGTFGYHVTGEVAYMLYNFCRKDASPRDREHQTVIRKHLEVLQVLVNSHVQGVAITDGAEILGELRNLAARYDPYRELPQMLRISEDSF